MNYSLTEIEKEFSKSININSIKSLEIKLKNGSFYLSKEHIYHNRDEIKSILHNVGDYYEQSVVKKGRGKYYKLTEEKVIKNKVRCQNASYINLYKWRSQREDA